MSFRRPLIGLLVFALTGAVIAGAVALRVSRGGMPQRRGTATVTALTSPVTIRFDGWGVPYVEAGSTSDLAVAVGWLHANDRLAQMELGRRQAAGRLAEVVGEEALPLDRYFRTLQLRRIAASWLRAAEPASIRFLESYAAGVNAWIEARGNDLPPEFRLLRLRPEPWEPVDSVSFALLMANELSFWRARPEEQRFGLLRAFGPERLRELLDDPDLHIPDDIARIAAENGPAASSSTDAPAQPGDAAWPAGTDNSIGSNNWALAASRSATGSALVANDPHLPMRLPGTWFQMLARSPGYDAAGMTLPGLPLVVVGRGPRVAWGLTNTMLDDHDVFFEEIDADGRSVRRGNGWSAIRTDVEEIVVRGAEPVRHVVRSTDRGILLDADPARSLPDRSLRWTAAIPGDPIAAYVGLARATTLDEIPEITASYHAPAQNLVVGHSDGEILYTLLGRVPDRRRGDGRLPAPGWDPTYGWYGLRPRESDPKVVRPADGMIVTANDDILPPEYPLPLTAEFELPHRSGRIRQLLGRRARWEPLSFKGVQNDLFSPYALDVVAGLGGPYEGFAGDALSVLRDWDGAMVLRGVPALFTFLERELRQRIFSDEAAAAGIPAFDERRHLLRILGNDMGPEWYDDVSTPGIERRDEIVSAALEAAWLTCTRRWGREPDAWNYGEIHSLTLEHPLGQIPVIGRWLNRGPLPMPGSATTVAAFGARWRGDRQVVVYGPSMRWITDTGDGDTTFAVIPAGQSGHPADPHYDDQLATYLAGELRPIPWSETMIASATVSMLRLVPGAATTGLAARPGVAAERNADEPDDVLDVLVVGGSLIDGTGAPARRAAVGIRGDRVAYIGHEDGAPAYRRSVDASDLVVAPGFVDVHTHALAASRDPERALARNYLHQGVTTLLAGNDGGGPFELEETFSSMESKGLGPNIGLFVGHDTVRRAVVGEDARAATPQELIRMGELVAGAMRTGAFGFSSGLYYPTGAFADTEEIVVLARNVAAFDGVYDTHLRDEGQFGDGLTAAVDEALEIGRRAGVAVHIAHIKALGPDAWGLSTQVIDRIEAARGVGQQVTADQYPYAASSTTLAGAMLPRWALAGDAPTVTARIADPVERRRIRAEVRENIRRRGGSAALVFASGPTLDGAGEVAGKTLEEVARLLGVEPAEAALRVHAAGGASVVSRNMNDADVVAFRMRPWVMTASDGSLVLPGEGVPHPRSYGTFPRVVAEFVRRRGLLTLEEAIRVGAGLPAATLGIDDRGVLRVGSYADIQVMAPERLGDVATFDDPHRYATGVVHLWVNGVAVISDSELTGARPGRALRRR